MSDRATHIDLIKETLRVAGLREPTRHRLSEVDFERTVDGLTTLVHRSGLDPVRSHELTWVWTISWDDLWAGLAACMGPTYPKLNTSDQKRIREHLRRHTSTLQREGHLHVPSVAAYVLGRRPDPG